MVKRILTVMLSFVMLVFPVINFSYAQGNVTDGIYVNIPFEKNADTLIVPDSERTAVINPDTWFAGLLDNYSGGLYEQSFSGGEVSVYNSAIKDGKMKFSERIYDTTNSKLITAFEGARTFEIPVDLVEDDDLDSFILSTSKPYGKDEAPSSLEIILDDTPSSSLYITSNRRGDSAFKATVYYKDGYSETVTIAGVQSNVAPTTAKIYDQATTEVIDGKTYITRNSGKKAYAVSTIDLGYPSFITDKMTNGVRDDIASYFLNAERRLVLHEIRLDSEKIPEKVVFETEVIYPAAIYSIAQKQLTNAELMEKISEAEALIDGEIEASDAEKMILANKYADILSERNYSYDFSKIRSFAYKKAELNSGEKEIKNGEKNLLDVSSLKFYWRDIADVSNLNVTMTENNGSFSDFEVSTQNNITIITIKSFKGESDYVISFDGLKIGGNEIDIPDFKFYTGGIYKDIKAECGKDRLSLGESSTIKVYGITENNNVLELSENDLSFSSDNPDVVSVDKNGKITAHKKGTAQITIKFTDPVSDNPYADENNAFIKTIDIKSFLLVDKAQGNRSKLSFFFKEAVSPIEAYFSDKSTSQRTVEAEVSFDISENRVDIIPLSSLDLDKEYVVTLVTEDMVYDKNVKFDFLVNEDFSDKEAYKKFVYTRDNSGPSFEKNNKDNADETLKVLHAAGTQDISMAYSTAYAKINEWKDYTVEFDYLYDNSEVSASDFIFYFLSRDHNQVMVNYDKKQATTISISDSRTTYISAESGNPITTIENAEVTGNKTNFEKNNLRVSGSMIGKNMMLNVWKIEEDGSTDELLYQKNAYIPIEPSALIRQTGTFAVAFYGTDVANKVENQEFAALEIDNLVCYKTDITDVEYSASIPFNARDLYNINEVVLDWNYEISSLSESNVKIYENEDVYDDFSISHDKKKTVITLNTPLKGESQYKISFKNISANGIGEIKPMDLSFFMGGIYKKTEFSKNRFVENKKSETVSILGTTDTGNTYTLVNDYITYSSENEDVFEISEDGVLTSKDRGYSKIKAVYNDPNTENPYSNNGLFEKSSLVYSYMSKKENISPSADASLKATDFDFKNGVLKVEFTDDLSKNMVVFFGDNSLKVNTEPGKYNIFGKCIPRTSGAHILEILKYEGKISVYLDGDAVSDNISYTVCDEIYVSGDMNFEDISVYNLIGSVCKADFVNVRVNGGSIVGEYNYSDEDNDKDTKSTYRWLYSDSENGTYNPIAGQTTKNFTATGYNGKYLKFEVTPANDYETGTPVVSKVPYMLPVAVVSGGSSSGGSFSGGGSFGGGGSSSSSGGFSTSGANIPAGAAQEVSGVAYKDVTDSHWAFDSIANLTDKKILNGFEDGTFRPDASVTRAQFVCAVLKLTSSDTTVYKNVFSDVDKDAWYSGYVQTAFDKGYILGDGKNFNPEKFITRQEMAVMIYRIFDFYKKGEMSFSDKEVISEWAYDAVAVLCAEGIFNGKPGNKFEPQSNATRAEMTVIFERIQEKEE